LLKKTFFEKEKKQTRNFRRKLKSRTVFSRTAFVCFSFLFIFCKSIFQNHISLALELGQCERNMFLKNPDSIFRDINDSVREINNLNIPGSSLKKESVFRREKADS